MGGGDNKIEETEQQKAFAEVSMKRWQDYMDRFRPYENKFMRDVDRLNDPSQYQRAAGMGALPVESQFSQAVQQSAANMTAQGINPNSGMFKSELDKLERNKAKVKSDMMNQAQVGQQNRYVQGLQNVVRMGQGQAMDSMQGLGDVANMANQKARQEASLNYQNRADNRQGVGAVIGGGIRYGLEEMGEG